MHTLRFDQIENKDGFYVVHSLVSAATAGNYGVIFTALHPCELMMVAESHTAAGTNGSAVTLQIEKLLPSYALDAGAEMLATGFNLKSMVDVPVIKEGSDLINRQLLPGDRIALKDTGTLTAVAGVQVTLYFKRSGKGDYR